MVFVFGENSDLYEFSFYDNNLSLISKKIITENNFDVDYIYMNDEKDIFFFGDCAYKLINDN